MTITNGVVCEDGITRNFHATSGGDGYVYVTSSGTKRVYGRKLWNHPTQAFDFHANASAKYRVLVAAPVVNADAASV